MTTPRDPKRACVDQLVATPAPRPADLTRQVAGYLLPGWQLAVIAALAMLVAAGLGLCSSLAYQRITDPHSLIFPNVNAWMVAFCAIAIVPVVAWAVNRRGRLARLVRDGSLAPITASNGDVCVVLDDHEYRVPSLSVNAIALGSRGPHPVRLLVHPEMRLAGIINAATTSIAPCRVRATRMMPAARVV